MQWLVSVDYKALDCQWVIALVAFVWGHLIHGGRGYYNDTSRSPPLSATELGVGAVVNYSLKSRGCLLSCKRSRKAAPFTSVLTYIHTYMYIHNIHHVHTHIHRCSTCVCGRPWLQNTDRIHRIATTQIGPWRNYIMYNAHWECTEWLQRRHKARASLYSIIRLSGKTACNQILLPLWPDKCSRSPRSNAPHG